MAASAAPPLEPTRDELKVTPHIVDDLSTKHYIKLTLDDSMSAKLFDTYLDNLDPARTFFLQQDIEDLSRNRYQLDDQLRKGRLNAGFDIYNTYQRRLTGRLAKVIDVLENDFQRFTFNADEELYIGDDKPAWPADEAAADEIWRKRIKHSILNLKITGKSDQEIQELLIKRYKYRAQQAEQVRPEDVFEAYINAYSSLYDPHTNYFSPRSLENFNIRMSLSLEGIGAVLSQEDEYTKVVRLVKGGPAEKQGDLERNDKIVAVSQADKGELVNVVGWRLDEVVDLIRGPKDSWVRLEIIPAKADDAKKTRIITIQRNRVELEEESASKKIIELTRNGTTHRIGVIEIPAFYLDFQAMREGNRDYRSTTRDVDKLMGELVREKVDGVVIDLRDNGGGSLYEVNKLIGLFIENGPTVQIRHANMQVDPQGKIRKSRYYDLPMVVITNRLSASASEIFAGAMQDYQRALVVGARSFGKGTVQALMPLPHGQMKITQSKYYRISGASTQHRGVVPDILFPAIFDPEEVGESTLKGALIWDTIAPMQHAAYGDFAPILPELTERHLKRIQDDPDFIYLQDQLALQQQARLQKWISLNEAKRIAEREESRQRLLTIENRRREAKHMEVIGSLDELEKQKEDLDEMDEAAEGASPDDDIYAMEAAHILLDMKQLNARVAIR